MRCLGTRRAGWTKRRFLVAAAGAIAAVAISAGACYAHWAVVRHKLKTITEGAVYQAGEMPPGTLIEVVEDHGIRTVIDLRKDGPSVVAEGAALSQVDVEYRHFPVAQVPAQETVDRFLDVMDDPGSRPVLIHCKHGEGRSGVFSAIYRMEYEGWSNDRARRATSLLSFRGGFSPGRSKGDYLLNYQPRPKATGNPKLGSAADPARYPETGA